MNPALPYALYTLLIVLLALLLAPTSFHVRGGYQLELNLQAKIRWLGGLFSLEVLYSGGGTLLTPSLFGLKKNIPLPRAKGKSKGKTTGQKRSFPSGFSFTDLVDREFCAEVKALLRNLRLATHLRLVISGRYGFDDPSATGLALAFISAALWMCGTVHLNPDFAGQAMEIEGNAWGYFIPFRLIVIFLLFVWARPVRAVWWPLIKKRKRIKEAVGYA